jgi:cytochrome d ubiquinol oxidase subunit II
LLGAGRLILKTEGGLQDWARRMGRICLAAVLLGIVAVSIIPPLTNAQVTHRWFDWPNVLYLAPVPIITALIVIGEWYALSRHELTPFIGAILLFLMSYIAIAISLWPMIVPYLYSLWQAASSETTQAF